MVTVFKHCNAKGHMTADKLMKRLLVTAEKSLVLSLVCKFNDTISTRFSLKMLQCVLYMVH